MAYTDLPLRPISFGDHRDLTKKLVNKHWPISVKPLTKITNRVCEQYPDLSRSDVVQIIKTFFEILREELLDGNIVHLQGYFRLGFFLRDTVRVSPSLIVKITPPKELFNDSNV